MHAAVDHCLNAGGTRPANQDPGTPVRFHDVGRGERHVVVVEDAASIFG